jgi:alpha-beta hydrolase superfamily lysophospholipase
VSKEGVVVVEELVMFYSEGEKIQGLFRTSQTSKQPMPTIIHAPGWMSLKDASHYRKEHEQFVKAGFSVLIFDYRGFGDSEGIRGWIKPLEQVADVQAAVSYLSTRGDVDTHRIGVLGSGGTGGGVAVFAAAIDPRIKCISAMFPVANGRDWLASMRRPYEWNAFLLRLEENRQRIARGGVDQEVDPLQELMIAAPERQSARFKKDIADRLPKLLKLSTADHILKFVPEGVVNQISPRAIQLIAALDDVVVPHTHAERLYQRAEFPKRLVLLKDTDSYHARTTHFEEIIRFNLEWFAQYLGESARLQVIST